jgi:cytochrome P450
MRLANVEGKLALAILIRKFRITLTPGAPKVETASAVTLKPKNGVHVTLSLRK